MDRKHVFSLVQIHKTKFKKMFLLLSFFETIRHYLARNTYQRYAELDQPNIPISRQKKKNTFDVNSNLWFTFTRKDLFDFYNMRPTQLVT